MRCNPSYWLLGLVPIAMCADDNALMHDAAVTPTSLAPAVMAADSSIVGARLQEQFGHDDVALAMLPPAIEAARTAHAPLTVTNGLLLLGELQESHHDPGAEATFRDALRTAIESDDLSVEIKSLGQLVNLLSVDPKRRAAASELAMVLEAKGEKSGWVDDRMVAAAGVATLALRQGDLARARRAADRQLALVQRRESGMMGEVYALHLAMQVDEAQADFETAGKRAERALAVIASIDGADTNNYAMYLGHVGIAARHAGRYDEATKSFTAALAIYETHLGHDSPLVAEMLNALGNVASDQGDERRARDLYREALAIWEHAPADDPRDPLHTLSSLGNSDAALGDLAGARSESERAISGLEAIDGTESPTLVAPLINLGAVASEQGKLDDAEVTYERALAIVEHGTDLDRTDMADILVDLGDVLHQKGHLGDAAATDIRAIRVCEDVYGPDHPHTGIAILNHGQVQLDQGNAREALASAQRARVIFEAKLPADHPYVAEARKVETAALTALAAHK